MAPAPTSGGLARVVCISHEDGAEGALVGRAVAQQLGMRYVDEEIVEWAAAKGGIDPGQVANAEARRSLVLRLVEHLTVAGTVAHAPATRVPDFEHNRELIVDVIRETAEQGNAVIGAHAASVALAGRADMLRVLVVAPVEVRARRIARSNDLTEEKALKLVRDSDAARASYLKRFHGVESERPAHYDLIVNTEALTPADAASLVARAARCERRAESIRHLRATAEPSDV